MSFVDFLLEGNGALHEAKNIPFLRYGPLSRQKQDGYGNDTFHAPPAPGGIYAFPQGAVETFLLGKDSFDQRRMETVKVDSKIKKAMNAENGSKVFSVWKNDKVRDYYRNNRNKMTSDEIDAYEQENRIWVRHISPKIFEHTGLVWSHLESNIKDKTKILGKKNSWVLTDYETWKKAFLAAKAEARRENYSKDHLEVFIERIENRR